MTQPYVDDKSTKIFAFDDLHPEDCAMIQALYSRSPAGVMSHLEKVKKAGSGKFMESYYIGYGHDSIGDCGVTTLFIENYSMLVAKAIQDNPLYSGQEASTRYLDFSTQPMIDPYNHPVTTDILNQWMTIYNKWMPVVKEALTQRYPFDAAEYKSERMWTNAVEARAFDTLRSLLPVGTSTLLSWTTNLRQARARLMHLNTHPLPEVREMAKATFAELVKKYPNSFNGGEMSDDTEGRYATRHAYNAAESEATHFQSFDAIREEFALTSEEEQAFEDGAMICRTNLMDVANVNRLESKTMANRPAWGALPRRLESYGSYKLTFLLYFGSYRDIQRHRNGVCQIPLIDGRFGFNAWYQTELEELLGDNFAEMWSEIQAQYDRIDNLGTETDLELDVYKTQYLYPMGTDCAVALSYSLPQMVYVGELRAGKTVHPSLRPAAQEMLNIVKRHHPEMALYGDMDADSWTAKRGDQTISEKKTA
jgi:thymidylate synthase ThyX